MSRSPQESVSGVVHPFAERSSYLSCCSPVTFSMSSFTLSAMSQMVLVSTSNSDSISAKLTPSSVEHVSSIQTCPELIPYGDFPMEGTQSKRNNWNMLKPCWKHPSNHKSRNPTYAPSSLSPQPLNLKSATSRAGHCCCRPERGHRWHRWPARPRGLAMAPTCCRAKSATSNRQPLVVEPNSLGIRGHNAKLMWKATLHCWCFTAKHVELFWHLWGGLRYLPDGCGHPTVDPIYAYTYLCVYIYINK